MKTCTKCMKQKPLVDFNKAKKGAQGRQRYCRPCQSAYYAASRKKRIAQTTASKQRNALKLLAAKYGVSEEVMLAFKQRNGGLCELCNKRQATDVDHDHATGELRGHLCGPCNRGLGFLGDTLESLTLAVNYLS